MKDEQQKNIFLRYKIICGTKNHNKTNFSSKFIFTCVICGDFEKNTTQHNINKIS